MCEIEINKIAKQQIEEIKVKCSTIQPLVVIQCITYNHEQYIREALEGFVMQQTNFPFVAIVHDDLSSDHTAEIIKEYSNKYPDIILPIIEIENQYSKRNGSLRRIMMSAINSTGAKYIAMCEGDDYWTDPLKLQKQIELLTENSDISLCFHPVKVVTEGNSIVNSLYKNLKEGYYNADTLISQWMVPTCSAVLTTESYIDRPYDPRFIVGDNVLWMNCCKHGKAYCLNIQMGVYRRNLSGWVRRNYSGDKRIFINKLQLMVKHFYALQEHFPNIGEKGITRHLRDDYARIFFMSIFYDKKSAMSWLNQGLKKFGTIFLVDIIRYIKATIKNRCILGYRKIKSKIDDSTGLQVANKKTDRIE